MKKLSVLILSLLTLALLLSACGQSAAPAPTAEPAPAQEGASQGVPEGMESTLPGSAERPAASAVTEAPVEEGEGEPAQVDSETIELVKSLIGEDIAKLYEAIGEPLGSDYAPSCLGDGEDGELYYNGFTVYTYRDAKGETVYDVAPTEA